MFVYVRVCTNGVKSSVSHVLYASLLYLTILMYWQGENHNTQPGLINVNVCTLGAKLGRNMKEMSACAHLAWCHFSKQTVITEVLWKFEWCFRRIFEICLFCLLFFFFFYLCQWGCVFNQVRLLDGIHTEPVSTKLGWTIGFSPGKSP